MATKFQTQFAHGKVEPFKCTTPSKTEQQFENELNINKILKNQVYSQLPPNTSQAMFGCTITGDEFINALNTKAEVMNYFEQLPAQAKDFFKYDPKNMLEFVQDKKNYEKAFELGLIDKKTKIAISEEFKALKAQQEANITPVEVTSVPEVTANSQS